MPVMTPSHYTSCILFCVHSSSSAEHALGVLYQSDSQIFQDCFIFPNAKMSTYNSHWNSMQLEQGFGEPRQKSTTLSFGYRNPTSRHSAAIRLDSRCDFILWFSGRDSTAYSHETTMQKHRRGKPGSAPSPALYMYRHQQKRSGIVLKRSDFDWAFLCLASRYLDTSVDSILESGHSLVHIMDDEHRQRQSEQEIRLQGDASSEAVLQRWERTINRRNALNRIALDLTVRGTKMPIPYLTVLGEAMRRRGHISILLKGDFAENQPSSAPCAPNAQHRDPAHGMRIECTSILKKQEGMHWRELWVTQGRKPAHIRLC